MTGAESWSKPGRGAKEVLKCKVSEQTGTAPLHCSIILWRKSNLTWVTCEAAAAATELSNLGLDFVFLRMSFNDWAVVTLKVYNRALEGLDIHSHHYEFSQILADMQYAALNWRNTRMIATRSDGLRTSCPSSFPTLKNREPHLRQI